MAPAGSNGLSTRMGNSVASMLPHIIAGIGERTSKGPGKVDLATAENWLLRPELLEICKDAIYQNLTADELSYPRGFGGDPNILEALASFFNNYFYPSVPVLPDHIIVTPGASSCLDTLIYNLCDEGDSVLVPAPYWSGFDYHFKFRSSVTIIPVHVSTTHLPSQTFPATENVTESLTLSLIPSLTEVYSSHQFPFRIKALIITNPHNPLSLCYPPSVLRQCMSWCHAHSIHFVSDEMYALSEIAPPGGHFRDGKGVGAVPFVSALKVVGINADDLDAHMNEESLAAEVLHPVDESRVHVVWGMSKDFGSSGIRLGCIVTQSNPSLRTGLCLLNSTTVSSLSVLFTTTLLTSPRLPALIALNKARLTSAWYIVKSFLQRWDVDFIQPSAGLYVFARLRRDVDSREVEDEMLKQLGREGVLVVGGRSFKLGVEASGDVNGKRHGWVRIVFAVPEKVLLEGLQKMERCLFPERRAPKRFMRCLEEEEDSSAMKKARKRSYVQ